jgi:hypothetical protein
MTETILAQIAQDIAHAHAEADKFAARGEPFPTFGNCPRAYRLNWGRLEDDLAARGVDLEEIDMSTLLRVSSIVFAAYEKLVGYVAPVAPRRIDEEWLKDEY